MDKMLTENYDSKLAAGLSRIRAERGLAASRSGSIPATPAPTPNPQLHVTYHVFPEQLAAGIKSIKVRGMVKDV